MGRRIPKQAITGFKFQNETDNIRPFLSIRIRGKDEIIPFKDKKEIQSVKAHLCSVFSGFVKIGDWYLKMSEVKEYKPVTAEDMNPYILGSPREVSESHQPYPMRLQFIRISHHFHSGSTPKPTLQELLS